MNVVRTLGGGEGLLQKYNLPAISTEQDRLTALQCADSM